MSEHDLTRQTQSNSLWWLLGGCLVAAILAVCALGLFASGLIIWLRYDQQINQVEATAVAISQPSATPQPTNPPLVTPQPTGDGDSPLNTPPPAVPSPEPPATYLIFPPDEIIQDQAPPRGATDLQALLNSTYTPYDYFETARRLSNARLQSRTINSPGYAIGDRQRFTVEDGQIEATLLAVTDNLYFWFENPGRYNQRQVQTAADRVETRYYPRLVNLFGEPWQPGVNNDPRLSILHLENGASGSELGYFSSVNQYPRSLYPESNEQEMVYLIMDNLELDEDLYYGTLVHELQHLIQWYVDPNEKSWLNEGFSQLAEIYLGYETATAVDYLRRPETRLNTWDYNSDYVDAHYSAAYLFLVYFWEQLGETAVQELSRHPANGLASVAAVLPGYDPERDLSDFLADWVAANFLDDRDAGPRYGYQNLALERPSFNRRVRSLPDEQSTRLDPFAVHYVDLDVRGPITITFAGDTTANLIGAPPLSGERMWYAPPQDESHARLTAVFDLTPLDSASLSFAAWYDLEEEYDFAYVSISADGGQTWELLVPNNAKPGDYGPAFNGRSDAARDHRNGWIKERISLNRYVGQPVMISFEVFTDAAVTGRGFAIDDIAVPELNYFHDAESDAPEWEAQGFVQVGWQLPQLWAVQFLESGPSPNVTRLPLNRLNQGQWVVEVGKGGGALAIIPLTPFIDDAASYWLHIEQ